MRTNRSEVTEVAHLRTDLKTYGEEHERIFGKKERKFRRLFYHAESDSLFEEYLTDSEVGNFFDTLDGSLCNEVTGIETWENRFKEEHKDEHLFI